MSGRSLPRKLRQAVLGRDNWRCCKCGFHSPTGKQLDVHHVISVSRGGDDEPSNLDTLCSACHQEVSWLWLDETPVVYATWRRAAPATFVMRLMLAASGEVDGRLLIEPIMAQRFIPRESARFILFGRSDETPP